MPEFTRKEADGIQPAIGEQNDDGKSNVRSSMQHGQSGIETKKISAAEIEGRMNAIQKAPSNFFAVLFKGATRKLWIDDSGTEIKIPVSLVHAERLSISEKIDQACIEQGFDLNEIGTINEEINVLRIEINKILLTSQGEEALEGMNARREYLIHKLNTDAQKVFEKLIREGIPVRLLGGM